MNYPIGEYRCKIDAKGRLSLPSGFVEQLGADVLAEGFVLRPSLFDSCLELFGMSDWRVMQAKLGRLNQFKAENLMLIRRFNAGARVVGVDANNRIQIPKDLLEKSRIVKDVVMTALTDRIQIWDQALLDEQMASLSDEDFANLLSEKMENIEI